MADSPSDKSPTAPDLRRTVGEATERIHEIIDAAEQVAVDIRRDAEAEARAYVEERRRDAEKAAEERIREADQVAEERSKALDQLTRSVADAAEEFKHQAEKLLGELDRVIVDARADIYRQSAEAALEDADEDGGAEDEGEGEDDGDEDDAPADEDDKPLLSLDSEPFSVEALAAKEPELPPLEGGPEPAAVTAYAGTSEDAGASEDRTSEALLRATQLAVTGKDRDEIADVLRADYPGVDTEPLLDEILG